MDTTFGPAGTGKVTTDLDGPFDSARAMAPQPDGKILVAGLNSGGASSGFELARYNANGTLDSTFGPARARAE